MKQIAFVMAEVVRQDDRAFLRRSTDCTLCIDASASKNVISFVAACASDERLLRLMRANFQLRQSRMQ